MDNLKVDRQPKDLEEMEMLNHALTHELSFQAQQYAGKEISIKVHWCGLGRYYLGAVDENNNPAGRDSAEYWGTWKEAQLALDNHAWTQRMDP
jgi:phosphopantetheinyl transferase (holo-ACP synthase)